MITTNFEFGSWLQALRKHLGYSRQEVADRSGGRISQQYIHFIETGRITNVGVEKVQAMAAGLGVPVQVLQQALLQGEEPMIPVLGRAAGGPEASALPEEYREVGVPYYRPDPTLFSVEIMGDSMSPKLEHGDLAVVQPQIESAPLVSGGVYLLRHRKKLTCKYLMQHSEQPEQWLITAEDDGLFPQTLLDKTYEVLGQVIEVRKTQTLVKPSF
ncbi:MAG: XRE family transcriptional regulator [Vampirovibrio sp.]|nr:XRE family transcriptional regulator [Vampirovibrio sp.]